MTDKTQPKRRTWGIRKLLFLGFGGLAVWVGILLIWGTQVQISGAVIGKGRVEVSEAITVVQHPIGGIVSEIRVREGDIVEPGDVLIRLDDTQLRSDLETTQSELFETLANLARLEALIGGEASLTLHPVLAQAVEGNADLQQLTRRQEHLLAAQRDNLATKDQLLVEQIEQIKAQIAGVESELKTRVAHRKIVAVELVDSRDLAERGLLKNSVLTTLQKDDLRAESDIARLATKIAELQSKITELGFKRHALLPTQTEKALAELSKLRPKRTKFLQHRASLINDLAQLDIRAPVSGKVLNSKVQGLRSVIVKAKPLMSLVPRDTPVQIKVRITAADVDQVYLGQEATLRFQAFNRRSTPVILGQIRDISADATLDPVLKKYYYSVIVVLLAGELDKLEGKQLIPGMPVQAFLTTQARTPLSYILKPLKDYFDRAFRDG